jgi:hypothetical protein
VAIDVAKVPVFTLKTGAKLHRIHRATDAPWFFNGSRTGRFDLSAPVGTCYLAEHPLGAFVETLRTLNPIPEPELTRRRLTTVAIDRLAGARLADITAARALAAGVTAAIATGDPHDYASSHAFAASCHAAGLAGIRYRVRHDPSQRLIGIALFGATGGDAPEPEHGTTPLSPDLIRDAEHRFGYTVLPAVL